MRPIRRILVAIKDPDARAHPVLKKAAQLARALHADLELFHALTWPICAEAYLYTNKTFQDVENEQRARVLKRLQLLADRLPRARTRSAKISVAATWDAPGYEAVIRRAMVFRADLIVAGAHNGRHIGPLHLHFNDWELLRLSRVPVLLIKRPEAYDHPRLLAAVDPSHARAKPARLDQEILDLGKSLSSALGGQLHSVHAFTPIPDGSQSSDALDTVTAGRINAKLAEAASTRYRKLLAGYQIPKTRQHLEADSPLEAIQRVARDARCDIVTMGALSRSGWRRVLIGNTAEELLDELPSDILIVKPLDFSMRISRKPTGARLVPAVPVMA